MSVDTSWDVDSYRTAYESEEHWALKRDFMEAHKDRIPEARLICLAQAFVNIELLGCKYPDALMEQVAVLARDIGNDFKESKKNKLQRTFVKASDAAGAKVKGTSTSTLLGASPSYNKPPLSSEHGLSMSPMSLGPSSSSSLSGPPSSTSSKDTGCPAPMSSLLGPPPTALSSRYPLLAKPMMFVKAGASVPTSMLGESSSESSMSSNSMPSMIGVSNNMAGGSSNSMSSMIGGSSNNMGVGSSSNSMKPMFGGSSNTMGGNGSVSSSSMTPMFDSMKRMFGGISNKTHGGMSTSNSMKPMFGGSSNNMGGGSSMPNSMVSAFSGSSNNMGGGSSTPNSMGSVFGGSSSTMSGGGSLSTNTMSSMFGGSSNSMLGSRSPLSNSMSSMFGGSTNSMLGGGGSSSNSMSSLFGESSNSLLSMSSGSATPKTTLITAPPAPKKKKSKADKEKDKPITEKFIKFIGSNTNTGAASININKIANTVPLQRLAGKQGETSSKPPQPAQPSKQLQPAQPIKQPQPPQPYKPTPPGQLNPPAKLNPPQQTHLSNWCKVVGQNNPLAGFVIVRHENNHSGATSASAVLNTSSCFSRIPINYHYQKSDNVFECTVNINGVDVVTAKAAGRKKAREQAIEDCIVELPKRCFTLKIKRNIQAESVTLDQVANDLASRSSSDTSFATNSVANKMMKQMGWTGGGLGKKGEGITEPIRPSEVFGRQGLGHMESNKGAVTPGFRKRVREIISEYASSAKNTALAFSNEFSKDQRAEIHKIARLCHLKSGVRGKEGKGRCLLITRKMPPQDLLLRLLHEGSDDQYELIPPSSTC